MNASVQRLRRTTPILRRPDDRWFRSGAPGPRISAMMMVVLVVSLAIHAGLIATALLADRPTGHDAPSEIAVEIVHEAPPATAPEKVALRKAVDPVAATPAPGGTPKPAKAVDDTPKVEPPKAEAAKSERTKSETHRSATPHRSAMTAARPAPPQPTVPEPSPAESPRTKPADSADAVAAMERELAALRAEKAALAAEHDGAAARPIGPHSFEAIALPSTSDTGEATGYESLVFSQLYKAKEAHRHEGLPGTATVVFTVDEAGRLVDAAVAVPSGIAALDAEALQLIREAAPFPAPPAGAQHQFSANVSFVVGDHY